VDRVPLLVYQEPACEALLTRSIPHPAAGKKSGFDGGSKEEESLPHPLTLFSFRSGCKIKKKKNNKVGRPVLPLSLSLSLCALAEGRHRIQLCRHWRDGNGAIPGGRWVVVPRPRPRTACAESPVPAPVPGVGDGLATHPEKYKAAQGKGAEKNYYCINWEGGRFRKN
jgi:hypothetical protein